MWIVSKNTHKNSYPQDEVLTIGSDPLPFQFWHRHASISRNAVFVDVDYPQLIARKRDRMLANDLLRDALLKTNLRSSALPIYARSDRYMALGCDLRDLVALEQTLNEEFDLKNTSILFVAEVSITYMPVSDADALIRWASTLPDGELSD
jgi:tRNA wybutosine-synthesizing protein 4